MKVIGLVAEGPTDVDTLAVILREHLALAGLPAGEDDLEVRPLQPEPDETTGRLGEGGWQLVHAWCKRHPPQKRMDLFRRPLFAGVAPCDVILVHVDADILELAEVYGVDGAVVAPRSGPARVRAERMVAVLRRWLWPDALPVDTDRHVLAPAVESTETWIVAGAVPDLADPEEHDPVPLLLGVSPGLADASGKLDKSRPRWRKLVRRHVAGRVAEIAGRCPEMRRVLGEVVGVLRE